jgi:hypothetical protein
MECCLKDKAGNYIIFYIAQSEAVSKSGPNWNDVATLLNILLS